MAIQDVSKTDSQLAARCAAVASIGAAVIHFAVAPMHWKDWMPSGVFFASMAVFQLLWGFVAWSRPAGVVLAAGVAGNAGSAALWVISRTAGAPFGPHAGQPEAVEAAGICVLLLQLYVVMGAMWAWFRSRRAEQVAWYGRALILLGANTVMAGAVAVGLTASVHGHHHHGGVAEAEGADHASHAGRMEGHHHQQAEPLEASHGPGQQPATAPVPDEIGLPVTEMGLHVDDPHGHDTADAGGDHHHDDE